MMGPKALEEIRAELRAALEATVDDPIRWLEEQVRAAGAKRPPADARVEESLLRFLSEPKKRPRARAKARAKK